MSDELQTHPTAPADRTSRTSPIAPPDFASPPDVAGPPDLASSSRAVRRNLDWLTTMLPASDGSRGIWERLRLDQDEVVYWVRPDCTAEALHAFDRGATVAERPELAAVAEQLQNFLLGLQEPDGAFPFYRYLPPVSSIPNPKSQGHVRYANDNGKVLELLALRYRRHPSDALARSLTQLADHLVENQEPEGWFRLGGVLYVGPCFLSWPAIGLVRAFRITGDDRHREAALRAIEQLCALQRPDGRVRTSYELAKVEDWRPVSSETAEAVRAFALAHRVLAVDLSEPLEAATGFLLRLSTSTGAIRNCDEGSAYASLQRDPSLTDLVYTSGYALHAWLDAWRATGSNAFHTQAVKLAGFLTSIQSVAPHEVYDGAWRGSYDVDRNGWRGRANQNNPIDEGGAHSVYTGWCNATITNGLLRLLEAVA